jgi:hypothetical protein
LISYGRSETQAHVTVTVILRTWQYCGCRYLCLVGRGRLSTAVICHGFVGYFQLYIGLSSPVVIVLLCVAMFLIASWGMRESALLVAVITFLEVGGLLLSLHFLRSMPLSVSSIL